MKAKDPIPVSVLTGFLGAGKTTLLNALLAQKHGYKCAIIINEFGAINIDNQLVVGADEEIVELNNGCLCCRVRGDLVKSLANLFQKQKRFDYVLIETTGLADPGPVAQTFNMPELKPKLRLDAIITVVDAKHIEKELNDAPEARAQIAFADLILVNKTDLAPSTELQRVETRLRKMNPLATIYRTQNSTIEVEKLLNRKARELTNPWRLNEAHDEHGHSHSEEDHDHPHEHEHDSEPSNSDSGSAAGERDPEHHHDESVRSFFISDERSLDLKKTEAWLSGLINTLGPDIYRAKGILHVKGQAKRVVFQAVQMIFEAAPERFWNPNERRTNQLVFIGKNLDEKAIRTGFEDCVAA
jgi:G3E family GTPase